MVTTMMDHITFDRSLKVLEVNARTEEKIVACVELENYFNHLAESNIDVTSLPIRSRYEKLMNLLLNCLEKDNCKMHLPVLQVLKLAIQVLPKGLGAGMKMASQCYSILLKISKEIEGNVENSPHIKMLVELFRCLWRFDDPQFIDAITNSTTLGYADHKELIKKCLGDREEESISDMIGLTDGNTSKNIPDLDAWISSLRLESLRFTLRLIKLCGPLFKSHFLEEMDVWLDTLLPSLFLYNEVYSSNSQKDCDADVRKVTREALVCILLLGPTDEQMKLDKWPKIKKDIKDSYADKMVKLVGVVHDWALIWCTVLDVLGGELIRKGNNHLINKLLNIASDSVQRSVRLLIQPLQPNNAKTDIMSRQKLNTWWHLIRHLEKDIEKHQKNVLMPFLNYCFGSTKSKEIPPGKKDLTNVEECLVLPCSVPLLNSPELFLNVSEELLHCVGESIVTLSCRSEIEVCSELLLAIWRSLLHHVSIVVKTTSERATKLIKDLLRQIQSLIERCSSAAPALASHIINLLKGLLMGEYALSYSVLSSPSYYVGSVLLMTGTPTLFLMELMAVLELGIHHHQVLEFTQSVLKHLETVASAYYNVNTVERAALCLVWCNIALALTEYLKESSTVNQGDNKQHDLNCIYLVLLFPFYHLYSINYKQTVEVLEVWRELYKTFHQAAVKSIPTLDVNEICETVSLKISQALMKHWPSTADQALPLLDALQNILTTIPFSEICRQSSKSKTKFLLLPDRGRSSKPTSYITYTMSLIVKVAQMFPTFNRAGEWYNTVGSLLMNCLEALFKNMKAADVAAAVPMVSGLSDSVLTLLQASPLEDGTARFWTESLQRLWKCYFNFIETYLSQKPVKDFLGWMSGLLEAGLKHSDIEIRTLTVGFWDKIVVPAFARDQTNTPRTLKNARDMCVVKETVPENMPTLGDEEAMDETFMTTNNNGISLSSLSGKVFELSNETEKKKPQSLVQQLTDEGHILTKHQKEVFRRRKEDIPALYSSTLQPLREDSMMSESSQDTSEFLVAPHVMETSSALLNSGEFKEPLPPSFKVLEPPSCLRRTSDYRKKMMIDNDGSIVLASVGDSTTSTEDLSYDALTSVPEDIVTDPHAQNSLLSSKTPVSIALVTNSLDPGNLRKLNLESVAIHHSSQSYPMSDTMTLNLATPSPMSSVETPISFPIQEPAVCSNVVIGNTNVVQSHNLLAPQQDVTPLKILSDMPPKNVAVVPKSSGIYGIIPDSRKLALSDTSNKKITTNVKNDYNKFLKERPKITSGNTFTPVSITVMEENERDRMRRTVHLSLPPPALNTTTPSAVCPKKFVEIPSSDVVLSDVASTILENDYEILEASSMSSVEISTSENDAPLSPVKVVVEKVEDYSLTKTTYAALETMAPAFIENDKVALQVEVSSSSRRKLKSPLRFKPGDPILPPFKIHNPNVPQTEDKNSSKVSSPSVKPDKKKENEVLKSIRQVSRTRRGRVGAKREHIKVALGRNLSLNTSGENPSPSLLATKTKRNYKPRKSRKSDLSDIAEDLKVIKEASMPLDVICDNSNNKQKVSNSKMSFIPLDIQISSKKSGAETNEVLKNSDQCDSEITSKTSESEVINESHEVQKSNNTKHENMQQELMNEEENGGSSVLDTNLVKIRKEDPKVSESDARKDTNKLTQINLDKMETNTDVNESDTTSKFTKNASISKKIRLDLSLEKKETKSLFPKVKLSPSKDKSSNLGKNEASVSSADPRLSKHKKSLPKLNLEVLPMNEVALESEPTELMSQETTGNKDTKLETSPSSIETKEDGTGKRKRNKRKIYEDFICLEDFMPKDRRRRLNDYLPQNNSTKPKPLLEVNKIAPLTTDIKFNIEADMPETLEDIEKEVQALTASSSNITDIANNDIPEQSTLLIAPHALEVELAGRDSSEEKILQDKHLLTQDGNNGISQKRGLPVAQNFSTESNMLNGGTKSMTTNHDSSDDSSPKVPATVENMSAGKVSNEEISLKGDLLTSGASTAIDFEKVVLDHDTDTSRLSSASFPNVIKKDRNKNGTSQKKQLLVEDKNFADALTVGSKKVKETRKFANPSLSKLSSENKSGTKDSIEERTLRKKHISEASTPVSKKVNNVKDEAKKSSASSHPKMPDSSEKMSARKDSNKERTSRKKHLPVQDLEISDVSTSTSRMGDKLSDKTQKSSSVPSLHQIPDSAERKSQGKDNKETRSSLRKRLPVHEKIISNDKTSKRSSSAPPKVPNSPETKSTRKDSSGERTLRKKRHPVEDKHVSEVSMVVSKKVGDDLKDKNINCTSATPVHTIQNSPEKKSAMKEINEDKTRRKWLPLQEKLVTDVSKMIDNNVKGSPSKPKVIDSSDASAPVSKMIDSSVKCPSHPMVIDSSENKSTVNDSNEEKSSQKRRLPIAQDKISSTDSNTRDNLKNNIKKQSSAFNSSKVPETTDSKPASKTSAEERKSCRKHVSDTEDKHIFIENQIALNVLKSRKLRSSNKSNEILKSDIRNGESISETSLEIRNVESDSERHKDGNKSRKTSDTDLHLQLAEAVAEITVKKQTKSHDSSKDDEKNIGQIQESTNKTFVAKENAKSEIISVNKSSETLENLSQDNDSLDIIESSQESSFSSFLMRRPIIHKCSVSVKKIDPISQAGTKIDISEGKQKYTVLVPNYPYSPFKIYSPEKVKSLKENERNQNKVLSVSHSLTSKLEDLSETVIKEVKSKTSKQDHKEIVLKSPDLNQLQKDSPGDTKKDTDKNITKGDSLKTKSIRSNIQRSEVESYVPKPKSKQHSNIRNIDNGPQKLEDTSKKETNPAVPSSSSEIAKTRSRRGNNSKMEDNVSIHNVDNSSRHRTKKHTVESVSTYVHDGIKCVAETSSVKSKFKNPDEVTELKGIEIHSEENATLHSKEEISNTATDAVEEHDKNSSLKQENFASKSELSEEQSKVLKSVTVAEDAICKKQHEEVIESDAKKEDLKSKSKQNLSLERAASSNNGVVSSIGDLVKLRSRSKFEEIATAESSQKQKPLKQSESSKSKEVIKSSVRKQSDSSKSKEALNTPTKDGDRKQKTLQQCWSLKFKEFIKNPTKVGDNKQKKLPESDSSKSKPSFETVGTKENMENTLQQLYSSSSKEVIKSRETAETNKENKQKKLQLESTSSKEKKLQLDSISSKEVIKSSETAETNKENKQKKLQIDSSSSKEVIKNSETADTNKENKQNTFELDSLSSKELIKSSETADSDKEDMHNKLPLDSTSAKEMIESSETADTNVRMMGDERPGSVHLSPKNNMDNSLIVCEPIINHSMSITEQEFNTQIEIDLNESMLQDENPCIEAENDLDCSPSLIPSKLETNNVRAVENPVVLPENADIVNMGVGVELPEFNSTASAQEVVQPIVSLPVQEPDQLNEDLEDEDQSIEMVVSKIKKFVHVSENYNPRDIQECHSSMEPKHKSASDAEKTPSPSPPKSLMNSPSSLLKVFSSPSGSLDLARRTHHRRMGGRAQFLVGLAVAGKEMNQDHSLITSPISSRTPEELSNLAATPLSRKKLLYNMSEEADNVVEMPASERLQDSDVNVETPLQYSSALEPRTPNVPLKRVLKLSGSGVDTPPSKKKKVSFSIPEVSSTKVFTVLDDDDDPFSPGRPKGRNWLSIKRRDRKTKALVVELNRKGVRTIGDLSRLDEASINRLPNYYKMLIEPTSDKGDHTQNDSPGTSSSPSSGSPRITTSDIVKYITSNKGSLTAVLEEVAKSSPCNSLNKEICQILSNIAGKSSVVSGASSSETNSREGLDPVLEHILHSDSVHAKHTQSYIIKWLISSGVNNVLKKLPQTEVARYVVSHCPEKMCEILNENPSLEQKLLQECFNSQLTSGELPYTDLFEKIAEGDQDNSLLTAMQSFLLLKRSPEEILQRMPQETVMQFATSKLRLVDKIGLCVQGILSDPDQDIPLNHYQRLVHAVAKKISSSDFATIHYQVMMDLLNTK
ncbi:hypothetical protein C0J52_08796 [Blattella germanica]|nr:hypothetical protein C0J52_08796 [Blattella germanica]